VATGSRNPKLLLPNEIGAAKDRIYHCPSDGRAQDPARGAAHTHREWNPNETMKRVLVLIVVLPLVAAAAWAEGPGRDLTDLTIEELMNIEITVTSAAKKPQKLTEAAAAISVVTGDQIRRAGVTSLSEAFRLVPGMHVARLDANKWAVASRGFNGRMANKLLVLIDGRHIYTPLFRGVFWEMQDTVLDDIDRIEIIRGPGGTLWGANAVNGVINVVTKSAKDTQGGLLTLGGGTEEQVFGTVRYGGALATDATYRIYAKYFERDSLVDDAGNDANDHWRMHRTGFRVDWDVTPDDTITVLGDYCQGDARHTVLQPIYTPPFVEAVRDEIDLSGAYVLVRWRRYLAEDSDLVLQAYHDTAKRTELVAAGETQTTDVDFQHRFPLGERHDVLWGMGVRSTYDKICNGPLVAVDTEGASDFLYNAFIQDEITIAPQHVWLTVGSKFEHNEYTGFEFQPSVRLAWEPTPKQTVWAAVSRAVRTPSRSERDLRYDRPGMPIGAFPVSVGNDAFDSEKLLAYEVGYRVQPSERVSLDVAAFYNIYDGLQANEPLAPSLEPLPVPHLSLPFQYANKSQADTYGLELAADFKASDRWLLSGGYSLLRMDVELKDAAPGTRITYVEGNSPKHMAFLRSSWALPADVDLDIALRYVDALPAIDVDSYTELDVRLAWRPTPDLELFVVGQNLLEAYHTEFRPITIQTLPSQVERSIHAGITWRF